MKSSGSIIPALSGLLVGGLLAHYVVSPVLEKAKVREESSETDLVLTSSSNSNAPRVWCGVTPEGAAREQFLEDFYRILVQPAEGGELVAATMHMPDSEWPKEGARLRCRNDMVYSRKGVPSVLETLCIPDPAFCAAYGF